MFENVDIKKLQLIFRALCVLLTNALVIFIVYYFLVPLIITTCTTTNCKHFKERVFNYTDDESTDEIYVELKLICSVKIAKMNDPTIVTVEHTSKFGEVGYTWICSKERIFETPYVGIIIVVFIFIIYVILAGICFIAQLRNLGNYNNSISEFSKVDQHDDGTKIFHNDVGVRMTAVNSTA